MIIWMANDVCRKTTNRIIVRWHEKKNARLLKEIIKEMNRLKSNCSANSSVYTLFLVRRLLLLLSLPFAKSMHALIELRNAPICEMSNCRIPRYLNSLNPRSYCGDQNLCPYVRRDLFVT